MGEISGLQPEYGVSDSLPASPVGGGQIVMQCESCGHTQIFQPGAQVTNCEGCNMLSRWKVLSSSDQ